MGKQKKQDETQARYWAWLAHTAPEADELRRQREERFSGPRWSVICPLTCKEGARITYDSLAAQTYPLWELCVAGEGAAAELLARRSNVRTAGVRREETALAAALRQANGSHILFLGCGDRLAPDALYHMSRMLADNPDVNLIYADEDALLPGGERGEPCFKPDYSPETLLSIPYMGRMVGYERNLLFDCGGLSDLSSEALYDLTLRASERARAVAHVPRMLLTCAAPPELPSLAEARRSVQAALDRRDTGGYAAAGPFAGSIAVQYGLRGDPKVSVIVTDTIGFPGLRRLLESIEGRSAYERYELIVVHDGRQSADSARYYAALERHKAARVFECDGGRAAMAARGAREAGGELLLFLSAGLELETPDALYQMAALTRVPGVGPVGGKLVTAPGHIYSAGLVIGLHGWLGALYRGAPEHTRDREQLRFTDIVRNVSAVDGSCLMVAHDLYRAAGGFDTTFSDVGWDAEFCLRMARRGKRTVYQPEARFLQHAPSREVPPEGRDKVRCLDALRPMLATYDPYYGPQYDYSAAYPRLAIPMRRPLEMHNA